MKYVRYTLSIGLNDKDTMAPVSSYERASVEMAGRLAVLEVGATITRGTGVYKHERGDVVIEDTVVISVIDFDGSFAGKMAKFIDGIKHDYNQESVAVMVDNIESKLV